MLVQEACPNFKASPISGLHCNRLLPSHGPQLFIDIFLLVNTRELFYPVHALQLGQCGHSRRQPESDVVDGRLAALDVLGEEITDLDKVFGV